MQVNAVAQRTYRVWRPATKEGIQTSGGKAIHDEHACSNADVSEPQALLLLLHVRDLSINTESTDLLRSSGFVMKCKLSGGGGVRNYSSEEALGT